MAYNFWFPADHQKAILYISLYWTRPGRVREITGLHLGGGGWADQLPVDGLHTARSGCGTLQTGPRKNRPGVGWTKGPWFAWKNAEIFGMVPYVSIFLLVLTAGNGGLGMGLLGWLLIVSQWIIPENSLRLAPVSRPGVGWTFCELSIVFSTWEIGKNKHWDVNSTVSINMVI